MDEDFSEVRGVLTLIFLVKKLLVGFHILLDLWVSTSHCVNNNLLVIISKLILNFNTLRLCVRHRIVVCLIGSLFFMSVFRHASGFRAEAG